MRRTERVAYRTKFYSNLSSPTRFDEEPLITSLICPDIILTWRKKKGNVILNISFFLSSSSCSVKKPLPFYEFTLSKDTFVSMPSALNFSDNLSNISSVILSKSKLGLKSHSLRASLSSIEFGHELAIP